MDSKLLNYSKMQIPILNESHTGYVMLPALLSQIDGPPLLSHASSSHTARTVDDHYATYYNRRSNHRSSHRNSHTVHNNAVENSKVSSFALAPSHHHTDCEVFCHEMEPHHSEDDVALLEQLVHPNLITKLIFTSAKETSQMIVNTNYELVNSSSGDEAAPTKESHSNPSHSMDSYVNCDLLEIDPPLQIISPKNTESVDQEPEVLSFSNNEIAIENGKNSNEESLTFVLNFNSDAPPPELIDINNMLNCFVAINRLDEKIDDVGLKFRCCVCEQSFETLRGLSVHKDENAQCKESYERVMAADENDLMEDESIDEDFNEDFNDDDDSLDLDLDIDIDEDLMVPERSRNKKKNSPKSSEKRPRRKYNKSKASTTSNLICESCSKVCRTRAELLVHIHKHAGNEAECWECGKKCASFSNLVSHVQLHTGEKPYTCQFCGKQFTQDAHLTRHIRLHTGERPFVCNICGKTYKDYSYYKTHERIHRGERLYKCKFCNKEYYDASYYKKHTRLHTGEKPYMCTVCGKQFHRSDYLKLHSFSHTDERPFYCPICGKGFKMNYNLKIHLKNHENDAHGLESTLLDDKLMSNEEQSPHECSSSELSSLIVVESPDCQQKLVNRFVLTNGTYHGNLSADKVTKSQLSSMICMTSNGDPSELRVVDIEHDPLNF